MNHAKHAHAENGNVFVVAQLAAPLQGGISR
jgi:hypothetical protein